MQPLSPIPFPHTKILLCGIKRVELHFLNSPTVTARLPITASLMQAIKGCLFQWSHDYDNILIWAARCVGFFVFLCCGEFLTPMMQSFNPNTFVLADVVLPNQGGSLVFHLNIKASKADQLHKGVRYFWLAPGPYVYPMQPLLDNFLSFNVLAAFNYLLLCPIRKHSKLFK